MGSPQRVSGYNTSSTSIMVRWDTVTPGERLGVITCYQVKCSEYCPVSSPFKEVTVNESVYYSHFQALEEYTTHSFAVRAGNSKGFGPWSKLAIVLTDEDGKWTNVYTVLCCCSILQHFQYASYRKLSIQEKTSFD